MTSALITLVAGIALFFISIILIISAIPFWLWVLLLLAGAYVYFSYQQK